jgi:hypothetical protein
MIGRTCAPSASAAARHLSCATGMFRPWRKVSHKAFAAVAICRRHEACASGSPGGSGVGEPASSVVRRLHRWFGRWRLSLLDLTQAPLDLGIEPSRRVVLDRAEEAFGRVERERLSPVPRADGLVVPPDEVVKGVQRELIGDHALQAAGEPSDSVAASARNMACKMRIWSLARRMFPAPAVCGRSSG